MSSEKTNFKTKFIKFGESRFAPVVLLFILILPMFFYRASVKDIWFCDEVYTFESANSGIYYYLNPLDASGTWLSGDVINDYLSKGGKVFNFIEVEKYLYTDHVPLYFLLIRCLSLVTYGHVGKWTALSLNLVFYLFFAWAVYELIKKLTDTRYESALAAAAVSLHPILISSATMIRMYMMLCACGLAFIYVAREEFWNRPLTGKRIVLKRAALIFATAAVTAAGLLTHYYFWLFVACFSLVYCIILLCKKHFAQTYKYVLIMILSLVFTTVGFPLVWKRTLFAKGENHQALDAVSSILDFGKLFERIGSLGQNFVTEVFPTLSENAPGALLFPVVAVAVIDGISAIVFYLIKCKKEKRELFILVFASSVLDILLISWLTVNLSVRYIWMPMILIVVCVFIAVIGSFKFLAVTRKNVPEAKESGETETPSEAKESVETEANHKPSGLWIIPTLLLVCFALSSLDSENIDWLTERSETERKAVNESTSGAVTLAFYDSTDYVFHCSFWDLRLAGPLMRVSSAEEALYAEPAESDLTETSGDLTASDGALVSNDEVLASADSVIFYTVDGNRAPEECCEYIEKASGREVKACEYVGPSGYMSVYRVIF